jgi:hypothetical protein
VNETRTGFTVTPADNGYIVKHQKTTPSGLRERPVTTLITANAINNNAEQRLVDYIARLVGLVGAMRCSDEIK